jgi:hypothetical protein
MSPEWGTNDWLDACQATSTVRVPEVPMLVEG